MNKTHEHRTNKFSFIRKGQRPLKRGEKPRLGELQTPTSNAMPFELNQVALQAELEGGQRWIRAHEIASELEFSNSEKIDAAKSNVNWNLVKKEITLLKLEGRFR